MTTQAIRAESNTLDSGPGRFLSRRLPDTNSALWPMCALAILAVLQFSMVFTRAINWDEYFYFHEVAAFAQGQLDRPLQTLHTRLFAWLPGLFATSTDHIVAARVIMFACELVSIAAIALCARKFADWPVAILCGLLYLSAGYVLQHGFSFRSDPLATALLMSALFILVRTNLTALWIIVFGICLGLAGLVTMKSVLYAPAFIGVGLMRLMEAPRVIPELCRLLLAVAATCASFALVYLIQLASVTGTYQTAAASQAMVESSASWIFHVGIPPYWQMAVKAAATAPIFSLLVLATPAIVWKMKDSQGRKLALVGLWLPVLTPFFYVNTAAYFYAFMLAPVAVACAPALQLSLARWNGAVLTGAIAVIGLATWLHEDRRVIDRQRQLETNVQEIFARPVSYFDQNFMLGAWPQANGFMTPWGMHVYRVAGKARYSDALDAGTVPLLLANSRDLQELMAGTNDGLLLPEDTAALRETYVEFSPYIWLAGKDIPAAGETTYRVRVPGPYTVHGDVIVIDGTRHEKGESIELERGTVTLANPGRTPTRLVYGDRLPEPSDPVESGPLYVLF
ncbi:ArnT family glycosyltransferase [Aurantiacibacter poecillastricola]|uniref:ArnT family glycosyltransferase n=1 Tax=Aurantiacibacter poecillastricola TaxID=3064385 RepID=UPI00273EB155|nr:hypothetical protein [Aurantiacibacter sp. 219JJ12-13]MDP5262592.1 hypothetical protein [Aurantiacibacter sp. 219JJ12-13]